MTPRYAERRQHAERLIAAANAAADPAACVLRALSLDGDTVCIGPHRLNNSNGRFFLVAVGKAAVPMAAAAASQLGPHLYKGISISKVLAPDAAAALAAHGVTAVTGTHPIATEKSITATRAVIDMLTHTTADDIVLCLISGGASALLTQPRLPLPDWQKLNQQLLASGCTINEFNAVRRRLDTVKGGGLARLAAPARVISLLLSDVIGNDVAAIGSGPTARLHQTNSEAESILQRYDIFSVLTPAQQHLLQNTLAENAVTAVPTNILDNIIIGDVRLAAEAVATAAAQQGFTPQILATHLTGEAREVGQVAAALVKDMPPNHCFILGGETTVTLRGQGQGGRNQELALAAAVAMAGTPHRAIFTYATDGEDGPTDAAGALVSGDLVETAVRYNLSPHHHLHQNDSYTFFHALALAAPHQPDGHLKTGSTGTNVNDLLILLAYEAA